MVIQISRAELDIANELTTLAHDAKRNWGYSNALIALWRTELTFTPKYIARTPIYIAKVKQRTVGVYALGGSAPECELDHLWVRPDSHGHGVGRALFNHAISTARECGAARIKIVSDPNAEDFYKKLGAHRIASVAARPKGRRLPVLRFNM